MFGLLFLVAALFILALAMPIHSLPALALLCFAFLPTSYLDMDYGRLRGVVTPAILVVAVWVVRLITTHSRQRADRSALLIGIIALVTLVVLSIFSSDSSASIYWVLAVLLSLVLPTLLQNRIDALTVAVLWRSWTWIGLLLAFFAIFESITQFNPLAGLYTVEQKWSVYRVTTTLGHPLMNGAFFAVTALVLGFGAIKFRRKLMAIAALLCAIATALTGARGGVVAIAVGLGVWLLLTALSARTSFSTKLLGGVFAFATAALILTNDTLRSRLLSVEAAGSAQYRDTYGVGDGWELFYAHPLFGTGPGTAIYLITERTGFVLESALIGALVSLGILGSVAIMMIFLHLVMRAVRQRSFEIVAGLAGFLVAGYGFPLWETRPSTFVMVTLLITLSTHSSWQMQDDDEKVLLESAHKSIKPKLQQTA